MSNGRSLDSHQWDSSIDPEISPLFLYLQWAQAKSIHLMRPLLKKYNLSLAEFDVLATLRNAPSPHEMTPTQIQNEVVITSGGLTKIMAQLENRGLTKRLQTKGDLRIKPVGLKEEGKLLIEAAMLEMIQTNDRWVRSSLDSDQIQRLITLLKAIADN